MKFVKRSRLMMASITSSWNWRKGLDNAQKSGEQIRRHQRLIIEAAMESGMIASGMRDSLAQFGLGEARESCVYRRLDVQSRLHRTWKAATYSTLDGVVMEKYETVG
jgi:hypothetical protein